MPDFGPAMPAHTVVANGMQRIVAPNPSMMTGPGTNTYLVGEREVAVVDPGPAIVTHIDRILRESAGPVRWILVTHTHPDHSPGVALLARETGAEVLGMPAPEGAHQDRTFEPTRVLSDGDVLETREFLLEAVHTPGHASNHLCYRHHGLNCLFTGDHVIDGSTVVIDPPDGNMTHYIRSLEKCKALACDSLAPGHGEIIENPGHVIDWIIEHRLEREAKVLAAVEETPGLTTRELVPHVYGDVDPTLYGWAERSLLAHVLKLQDDALVESDGERWSRLI